MRKIPTVFKRDPDDMKRVLSEVTPGCEWVLAGEGEATRKYDGTCCMFDGQQWWARREVKPPKTPPPDFVTADHDPVTGRTVGWVPMESSSFAKWHAEAIADYPDDGVACVGTYELCGPKINGNPEGFDCHVIVRHSGAERLPVDVRTFEEARALIKWLAEQRVEGIVWHHPDGRMAKLKARDFPGVVA